MTRAEALEEARRRWGPQSVVSRTPKYCPYGTISNGKVIDLGTHRVVGAVNPYTGDGTKGYGWSWEAAFADADRRGGASS